MIRNRVLFVLVVIGIVAALFLAFLTHAPNRLLTGASIPLIEVAHGQWFLGLVIVLPLLLAPFVPQRPWVHIVVILAAGLLQIDLVALAGSHAAALAAIGKPAERTSFGGSFWVLILVAALAIGDAQRRLGRPFLERVLMPLVVGGGVAFLAARGDLDQLSLARELAVRHGVFMAAIARHIVIVGAALVPTLIVGVPLGVLAQRRQTVRDRLFPALNIVQTIPSVALFGLLIGPLSGLAALFPSLASLGISGIGLAPAILALVLYSLLPIVRNTVAGLDNVPAATRDAGSGLGMTQRQLFWRVELPLALPIFLAGLRITTVQAIGLAAVAALIGAGGLGAIIFQGLFSNAQDLVLLGTLPLIALALVADAILRLVAEAHRKEPCMIELDHVSKRYGASIAVDDVSLTIGAGELFVLIGPSGSGKSTILRMINRLIPHTSGTIRIGGTDITQLDVAALRRRMGYVIQSIGLFPHWTIERNVGAVPEMLGWDRARIAARVTELLTLLRLDPETTRRKYPHQLSGGQQQRVGVARALAADPEVLLMDEPFGALDPVARDALQIEIAQIQRASEKTIVFVTHDMEEALRLGSRIAILEHGRLVQCGPPLALLRNPANDFVRRFVGQDEHGIRLLSVVAVADRLRPIETGEGEPIATSANLRQALSLMIERGTDRLPVADASGAPTGTIHLADLVRR